MKILIVEDEKELRDTICTYLENEGFICEKTAHYEDALEKVQVYTYDLVVLDITLPDGNGLNLLRYLKNQRIQSGVLIVSAKDSLEDKLTGLELGADDYITKPFHLAELNARVKSIIRRKNFDGNNEVIFQQLKIDISNTEARVNEQLLELTRKEYELLIYFIHNQNRVLTKEAIAEHLWGDHMDMADSFDFIYTHIKNLRRKIQEKGGDNYIKTVYGMGYKFAAS